MRAGPFLVDEGLIEERFVRSSGPGGQNVNKVATAVELRFDISRARVLPDDVRARLARLAGRRLTLEGVLVIQASAHRTQERNRADARARLADLIARAAEAPKPRRATKPTYGSKLRRLDAKTRRGATKRERGAVEGED